jgi:hypothetical protein
VFSAKIELDYPFSKYLVEETELNADQTAVVDGLFKALSQKEPMDKFISERRLEEHAGLFREFASTIEASAVGKPVAAEERKRVLEGLEVLVSRLVPDPLAQKLMASKVLDRLFGYVVVQPLFEDGNLEEIMINSLRASSSSRCPATLAAITRTCVCPTAAAPTYCTRRPPSTLP